MNILLNLPGVQLQTRNKNRSGAFIMNLRAENINPELFTINLGTRRLKAKELYTFAFCNALLLRGA
jgi:hypothetical protein